MVKQHVWCHETQSRRIRVGPGATNGPRDTRHFSQPTHALTHTMPGQAEGTLLARSFRCRCAPRHVGCGAAWPRREFGNEGRLPGTVDTVNDDTRARFRSRRPPQRSSGSHCVRCARCDSGSAANADRPALCEVTVWRASVQPLTGQLLRLLQYGATASHQSRLRLTAVSSANTK